MRGSPVGHQRHDHAAQALRAETAASTEALEAERAAKFAADAEATELQRSMDDLNAALRRERYVLEGRDVSIASCGQALQQG